MYSKNEIEEDFTMPPLDKNSNKNVTYAAINKSITKNLTRFEIGKVYVLLENVAQNRAFEIMNRNEYNEIKMEFEGNKLYLRRAPITKTLAICKDFLLCQLLSALPNMHSTGSSACKIGNDTIKKPDASFEPDGRRTQGPYLLQDKYGIEEFPTIVFKISNRGGGDEAGDPSAELINWTGPETTINVAIAIQIQNDKKNEQAAMVFYMCLRGIPGLLVIDSNECKGPDDYLVKIPLKFIYDGGITPNVFIGRRQEHYILDLFALKEKLKLISK